MSNKDFDMRAYIDIVNESNKQLMEFHTQSDEVLPALIGKARDSGRDLRREQSGIPVPRTAVPRIPVPRYEIPSRPSMPLKFVPMPIRSRIRYEAEQLRILRARQRQQRYEIPSRPSMPLKLLPLPKE